MKILFPILCKLDTSVSDRDYPAIGKSLQQPPGNAALELKGLRQGPAPDRALSLD